MGKILIKLCLKERLPLPLMTFYFNSVVPEYEACVLHRSALSAALARETASAIIIFLCEMVPG